MDSLTLRAIRIAIELIGARVFSIMAMAMTFALACWVMWEPTYERLGMAGFFAVAVYIPSLRQERGKDGKADT